MKELIFLFNCQVCFKFGESLFADIGDQETADYIFNSTSAACVLLLTGKAVPSSGNLERFITFVLFVCMAYINLHRSIRILKLYSVYIFCFARSV